MQSLTTSRGAPTLPLCVTPCNSGSELLRSSWGRKVISVCALAAASSGWPNVDGRSRRERRAKFGIGAVGGGWLKTQRSSLLFPSWYTDMSLGTLVFLDWTERYDLAAGLA